MRAARITVVFFWCLFNAGLKGKLWRIIKHWYTNPTSCVRVCNKTSIHFPIGRGVQQGSVLSPTLFNRVLDPLLTRLKSMQLGLNINVCSWGPLLMQTIFVLTQQVFLMLRHKCLLSTPTQTLGVSNCVQKNVQLLLQPQSPVNL